MHLNPSQPLLALHWQPPVEQMVVCAGVHGFGGPGGPGGALQGVQVKLNTSQWWQFGRALQIVQKLDGWAALVVAARRRRVVVCNSVNSVNSMFDVDGGLTAQVSSKPPFDFHL